MDITAAIREGRARVEWTNLVSEYKGHRLTMRVFRDAMKIDNIRQPVTAKQMQEVADLCACMMPTPKILDLIWIEAGKTGVRFDPIINFNGKIVADLTPEVVSPLVDAEIHKKGDNGGIIDSVGKYWVLTNTLNLSHGNLYGIHNSCNYGWHSSIGVSAGVTPGLKVWQGMGWRHNDEHVDPSQVIRLVFRMALLLRAGSSVEEQIDLHDVLKDPELAGLISHEGPLTYLRQASVPEPQPVKNADGSYTMPEIVIL